MKLYNDQHNAQVFNLFICLLLPYMFRASLAHLQRQVYKFGSGSSLLGMVSVPGRWHHTQETWITYKFVHQPLKMGYKKVRNI
jgi:hypothetical protein